MISFPFLISFKKCWFSWQSDGALCAGWRKMDLYWKREIEWAPSSTDKGVFNMMLIDTEIYWDDCTFWHNWYIHWVQWVCVYRPQCTTMHHTRPCRFNELFVRYVGKTWAAAASREKTMLRFNWLYKCFIIITSLVCGKQTSIIHIINVIYVNEYIKSKFIRFSFARLQYAHIHTLVLYCAVWYVWRLWFKLELHWYYMWVCVCVCEWKQKGTLNSTTNLFLFIYSLLCDVRYKLHDKYRVWLFMSVRMFPQFLFMCKSNSMKSLGVMRPYQDLWSLFFVVVATTFIGIRIFSGCSENNSLCIFLAIYEPFDWVNTRRWRCCFYLNFHNWRWWAAFFGGVKSCSFKNVN